MNRSRVIRSVLTPVGAHGRLTGYRRADAVAVVRAVTDSPRQRAPVGAPTLAAPFITAVLRAVLVAGSVATAAVAWWAASGSVGPVEPGLAPLLRGMAVLKGFLAVAAGGVVWWRLGQPVDVRAAAAYIACVSGLCAGSALIWQVAFVPAAALLYHLAGLAALVLAWREGGVLPRFGPQASDSTAQAAS